MSLSPAQTKKHWNHWKQVVAANDWVMAGGRIDTGCARTADESFWHRGVWKIANALALDARRKATADDLRHACYLFATTSVPGWPSSRKPVDSIKDFGNAGFSRLLVLFRLLVAIGTDDVDAACEWEDPQREERERLVWRIEHSVVGSAYAEHVSFDMYGTRDWRNLPIERLRSLNRLIWGRQRAQGQPVSANEPF
jgi:hypothetical protein